MGVDARIKDLTDEIISSELSAVLSTLYLAVDATSFSEAQKVKWSTLINSAAVTVNTNDYQAMTPKAFYDSVMTETIRGINRMATTAEVTAKTGTGVLVSEHQEQMQTQWLTDIFVGNSLPDTNYYRDSFSQGFTAIRYADSISANGSIQINPTLGTGKSIGLGTVMLAVAATNMTYQGFVNIPTYSGGGEQTIALSGSLQLRISADRKIMKLVPLINTAYFRVSATVNIIVQ